MILDDPEISVKAQCETVRLRSCTFMAAPICRSDQCILLESGDSDHI